jgi:hypothetical protein
MWVEVEAADCQGPNVMGDFKKMLINTCGLHRIIGASLKINGKSTPLTRLDSPHGPLACKEPVEFFVGALKPCQCAKEETEAVEAA